jgi:phage-related protein
MSELKKVPASFYQTANGKEPVRDWLLALDVESRRIVGRDIATAEFGWPVGMPLSRSLGGGLYEIRSNISRKRIARVIFVLHRGRMVLLHGFVKKSQKTPKSDLDLARQRGKEITR